MYSLIGKRVPCHAWPLSQVISSTVYCVKSKVIVPSKRISWSNSSSHTHRLLIGQHATRAVRRSVDGPTLHEESHALFGHFEDEVASWMGIAKAAKGIFTVASYSPRAWALSVMVLASSQEPTESKGPSYKV
jgi:hypothetical protein